MKLTTASVTFSLALLLALGGNAWVMLQVKQAHDASVAAQEHRREAVTLIDEIRQETQKRTILVRAYTATGKPTYLLYYYDSIFIRNGGKLPPPGYNPRTYWDQAIAGRVRHDSANTGQGPSLARRMQLLGFNPGELDALNQVLATMEVMTRIEQIAFAATQGLYDPDKEEFVSDGQSNLAYAGQVVHGDEYNRLIADLSLAVENLSTLVEQRTQAEVLAATEAVRRLILASLAGLLSTFVLVLVANLILRRQVLKPIGRLAAAAEHLAGGDYSTRAGDLRGVEEMASLGKTMDSMAQSIENDIHARISTQQELEAARQLAEQATRTKSAFLANMSHEIRTPMNAIMGMADLCLDTDLDSRQRNYVSKIRSASESLLRILNDILDFSKIEAGKMQMEQTRFVLESVFDQLSSVTALRAEYQGIELVFDIDDDSQVLIGDPLRLGQVLINLVTNALKFSAGGSVVVSARCEACERAEAGDTLEIHFCVRDEGIGMSAEQVAQLFQPFSQADASTTRRYGGTGLGLAISRHFVDMMGGRIWAESVVGIGSSFHFTARFGRAGADPRNEQPALEAHLKQQAGRAAMVIDDNPIARRILEALLTRMGLTVVTAESAESALAQVNAEGAPAWLIFFVDWKMPEVNGIETIRRLREIWRGRQQVPPPMMLVTAFSHREEVNSVAGEVDGLLAKPLSLRHLRAELARSLGVPAAAAPEWDRRKPIRLPWSRFRGLDILLAEDMESNQEVMLALLANVGLTARLARHGEEVLEQVARRAPDLILMDCQMPVMDGYQATQRLRENPAWRNLPIIALTANATTEDQERCLAVGMNAHLSKPLGMDLLYEQMLACFPRTHPDPQLKPDSNKEPDPPPSPHHLPQLPGLDLHLGLAHSDGSMSLLLRLLQRFRDNHGRDFEEKLARARAAGDVESETRLAHSLKGLARTLGACDLGEAAEVLEKAAAAGDQARRDACLPELLAQLRRVMVGLADLESLIAVANPVDLPPASTRGLAEQLEQLDGMLERCETEANELALEIGPRWGAAPGRDTWNEVARAIDRFDFDQARAALLPLRSRIAQWDDPNPGEPAS